MKARAILLLLTGMLAFAVFSMVGLYSDNGTVQRSNLPEIDAVVCLAGAKGRIAAAAEIFLEMDWKQRGHAPIFFVAGMGKDAGMDSFRSQVGEEVYRKLPLERVTIETRSKNTLENAKVVLKEANSRNWRRILVLTSSYHLKRSRFLFEREARFDQGIKMEWLPLQQKPWTPGEWWKDQDGIELTLMEWAKWFYYRITAWER